MTVNEIVDELRAGRPHASDAQVVAQPWYGFDQINSYSGGGQAKRRHPIGQRHVGTMISTEQGTAVAYALWNLQERGP